MNLKIYILLVVFYVTVQKISAQTSSFFTQLPLIYINTNGEEIRDEPKIVADLGIIWNGPDGMNRTGGDFNHFNGKIAIEIRGSSSQSFPKKSYGFELRDIENQDLNFPLLGLPEEEDWILYAPYSDKSLIRNVLTFTLAGQLGEYAPRCRLVELFLNGKYNGVYVLMEKIKRDKNRLDIANLKPDDISGEELTGGYIVKIDKTTGSGGRGWYSHFQNENNQTTYFQYEEPESDEIKPEQEQYIQNYFHDFEAAVYNKNFDTETGYQKYIDINSFIDYMIINEISKNVDGYRLSAFLYKDKNEKINAGPIWDFNLGYGNANYYNAWETYGLQIYADLGGDGFQNPFWWRIFMGDKNFTKALRCRWDELYSNILSTNRIINVVDSLVNLLANPLERNFQRWPVLGEYVWPNYYVAYDYNSEVTWLKNWIYERMRSLHLTIPGDCGSEPTEPLEFSISTFPNPFTAMLVVQVTSDANLLMRTELFSISGEKVFLKESRIVEGLNRIEVNTNGLSKGIYIYRIFKGENEIEIGKVIKI